jgi:hypothetical protein
MADTTAYCARLGTYQWVGLIVAIIIVLIILVLISINYAKYINSAQVRSQSGGVGIDLNPDQAKTTRGLNIGIIILIVILLLMAILYVYGDYLKGKVTYQPVYTT